VVGIFYICTISIELAGHKNICWKHDKRDKRRKSLFSHIKIHQKIVGQNSGDIFNRQIKVRVSQHVPHTDQGVLVPRLTNE